MKFLQLLFTFSIITQNLFILKAQEAGKEKYYKLVQILPSTNFSLNKLLTVGKSSTDIPLTIPKNTVKWVYTLSSDKIEQKTQSNLLVEMSKLFSKGIYSGFVKSLTAPSGVIVCNINIMDGGYLSIGSRSMLTSGIVEVIPNFSNQIITLENPNFNESIKVQIEAVAIVFDKEQYNKDQLDDGIKSLSNALSDISEASKKAKEEKQNKEIADSKSYFELAQLKMEKEDYKSAINIYLELAKSTKYYDYIAYQGLGTAYRYIGEYDKAISAYQKSIKENKDNELYKTRVYSGMGLTYLLNNDENNANKFYAEAISHCKGENALIEKKAMITAIEKARLKNTLIAGSDDIIQLLSK